MYKNSFHVYLCTWLLGDTDVVQVHTHQYLDLLFLTKKKSFISVFNLFYIPISQKSPLVAGGQLQILFSPCLVQVPPNWQGFCSHAVKTVKRRHKVLDFCQHKVLYLVLSSYFLYIQVHSDMCYLLHMLQMHMDSGTQLQYLNDTN